MSGPIAASQVRYRQQGSEDTCTPFGKPVQLRLQQTPPASLHNRLDGLPDATRYCFCSFSFFTGAFCDVNQKVLRAEFGFLELVDRLSGIKRQRLFENKALKDDSIHIVEEEMRDKISNHLTVRVSRPTMSERA